MKSLLDVYTDRARTMTVAGLTYAIRDIQETQATIDTAAPQHAEYARKLYAEFDAYTVELHKRQARFK